MKIFDIDKNNLSSEPIHTLFGCFSEFCGKLSFAGSLKIDGKFRGEIFSEDNLIIGESAELEASVIIGTIIIHGKFKGNIEAFVNVELSESSVVEGNIITPSIVIKEGAKYNGICIMKN